MNPQPRPKRERDEAYDATHKKERKKRVPKMKFYLAIKHCVACHGDHEYALHPENGLIEAIDQFWCKVKNMTVSVQPQ